jgi:CheY-like chemotaxis protein
VKRNEEATQSDVPSLGALLEPREGQGDPDVDEVSRVRRAVGVVVELAGFGAVRVESVRGVRTVDVHQLSDRLSALGPYTGVAVESGESAFLLLVDPLELVEAGDRASRSGSGVRILLAEDSPTVRRLLSRALTRAGHTVVEAGDGLEALSHLDRAEQEFELLITDLEMPRLDGFGLVDEVRKSEKFGAIPIVVVTSNDSTEVQRRIEGAEISGFVLKQGGEAALLRAAREAIAARGEKETKPSEAIAR